MTITEQTQTRLPVGTFAVDPGHSTIEFRVTDTTELIATVSGHFTEFEGTFELAEDAQSSRAYGLIKTASVETHDEKRDEHLQSHDFFDADVYAEIRFDSTRIEQIGADRFLIAGELTIKDFSHEIELESRLVASGTDRFGKDRVAFESRGELEWRPFAVQLEAHVSAVRQA